MEAYKLYDWLIVVFLHEVQQYLCYSDEMKAAIEKVGCGDDIAVFLIQDSVSTDPATSLPSFQLSVSRLKKTDATGDWSFTRVESPDLHIDNPDRHCWETAFQYIYTNYYGERNMLITFSEGAAYGINVDPLRIIRNEETKPKGVVYVPSGKKAVLYNKYYYLDKDESTAVATSLAPAIPTPAIMTPAAPAIAALANSASTIPTPAPAALATPTLIPTLTPVPIIEKVRHHDLCKNLEILWIAELARALERYLPASRIDVLLMANCYMQVFDNGYCLSKSVKFLVAAENYVACLGYNFDCLMRRLIADPAIPSETLVKYILSDLQQLYEQRKDVADLMSATIFANRLKFYPIALKVFEELIRELEHILPHVISQLADIRNNQVQIVTGNTDYPLIDAGLWVQLVTEQIPGLKNAACYRNLFKELQDKIVTASLISDLTRETDKTAARKYGFSGISIYYPQEPTGIEDQNAAWCASFDRAVPSPFRVASRWNIFLEKYFKALAQR